MSSDNNVVVPATLSGGMVQQPAQPLGNGSSSTSTTTATTTTNPTTSTTTSGSGAAVGDFVLVCKADNAKSVSTILSALHYKKESGQIATVSLSSTGIRFTVEEAKSFQGSVVLEQDLFQEYKCSIEEEKEEFKINFSILLDCLGIYGANPNSFVALQMAYEGYGHPLLLMLEENGIITSCALKTLEPEKIVDFRFRTYPILNKVIMEADYLKEAFNELDWSSQLITFTLSPEAPHFRLSTSGPSGSCQVDYPKESEVFESFECETTCSFSYKLSLLQPAVKALSLSHKTQLRINDVGVLSIQHMIKDEEKNLSFVDFLLVPVQIDEDD